MFYPLQIPNILHQTFKEKIEYKEYIPEKYKEYVMCIWSMKSKGDINLPIDNMILPDGCIDLVINFETREIIFSASSKATIHMLVTGNVDFMGIRIRPGLFHNIYKIDSTKIMDKRMDYKEFETEVELDDILNENSYEKRVAILMDYLNKKTEKHHLDLFVKTINQLENMSNMKYVTELSKRMNYSERQMQRIFKKRCGYTIKTYLNIIRLHKALDLLIANNDKKLTQLASQSGFFDQAHLIKDIEKYCGVSPGKIIDLYQKMS